MKRRSPLPELLSPAGSFEALVAAVNAGADAVYFGGKKLNARTFARNFDDGEIARAILSEENQKLIYIAKSRLPQPQSAAFFLYVSSTS